MRALRDIARPRLLVLGISNKGVALSCLTGQASPETFQRNSLDEQQSERRRRQVSPTRSLRVLKTTMNTPGAIVGLCEIRGPGFHAGTLLRPILRVDFACRSMEYTRHFADVEKQRDG
ncbi:hypothetical protein BJX68DRAFT_105627 [Aspergillus pseudodeflectus]|uniref:Uncharacterized protein n=1 Tax=Aspergillus pseudodeflectus TaxID=176178 RepID=A0ABR4K9J6_9EURO